MSELALTKDSRKLEGHLKNAVLKPLDDQRRILGGLALRLSAIGVNRAVVEWSPDSWEVKICEWVRTSPSFEANSAFSQAFPKGYADILLYFLAEQRLQKFYTDMILKSEPKFKWWDYYFLKTSSSPEQIAQFRFLPQFLAVVWAAPKQASCIFSANSWKIRNRGRTPATRHFCPGWTWISARSPPVR